MKQKILSVVLAAATAMTLFTGCGGEKKKDVTEIKVHATQSELENGNFYIKHQDGTFDQVYPGHNENTGATNIMWFKDDFSKIPHLVKGKGDTLVYYQTADLDGSFNFSRYYDLGYSVGLCGLTPNNTGRYSMAVDGTYTYPGSDADQLLNGETSTVVIDAIGGRNIRKKQTDTDNSLASTTTDSEDEDSTEQTTSGSEDDPNSPASDMVTKYGTIKNLQKDQLYRLITYNGTVRKTVNLTANVRMLGYADSYTSNSYAYGQKDANLIEVGIPLWFNDGYYTIQSGDSVVGMFCFVNGSSYDDDTDFNNPNKSPESDKDKQQTNVDDSDENRVEATSFDDYMDMTFNESGYATITFTIKDMTDEEAQEMAGFTAGFFVNGTQMINFVQESPGTFVVRCSVAQGTSYRIGYSGLPAELQERAVLNYNLS